MERKSIKFTEANNYTIAEILYSKNLYDLFMGMNIGVKNAEQLYNNEIAFVTQIVTKDPKFQKIVKSSFYEALTNAFSMSVTFSPTLKLGYFDIRKVKDQDSYTCSFNLTAQGKIDALIKNGAILAVDALELVYDCDAFDTNMGKVQIHKRPNTRPADAKPIAVYGIYVLPNGREKHLIVYKDKLDVIKKKSTDSYGLWKEDSGFYDEMAKKTNINQLFKVLPKSRSLELAFQDTIVPEEETESKPEVQKTESQKAEPLQDKKAEITKINAGVQSEEAPF